MNQKRISTLELPTLLRNTVGFDRFLEEMAGPWETPNYPPYNVIKIDDDNYKVEVAVAGFKLDELDVETSENRLVISGEKKEEEVLSEGQEYRYKGISNKSFTRSFTLGEYFEVNGARLENGLLIVDLVRNVPESKKVRKIEVKTS